MHHGAHIITLHTGLYTHLCSCFAGRDVRLVANEKRSSQPHRDFRVRPCALPGQPPGPHPQSLCSVQPKRKHGVFPNVPAEFGGTCHEDTWGISEAPAHKSCCVIGRVLPMLRPTQTPHRLSWQGAKPPDQVALSPPSPSLSAPRGLLSCGAKRRLLARCPAPRKVQWPGPHSPGAKV